MFAFNTLTVILSILVQGQEFLNVVGDEKSLLHPSMMKKGGKIPYLKMKLIDNGATLFDYLQGYQKNLVSVGTIRDLIIQVKRKLDYLNNLGIFHHDCHVWNFLISYEEGFLKVYIIDFGWSSSEEGEDFASFCQGVEDVFLEEDPYITDILDEVSCLL